MSKLRIENYTQWSTQDIRAAVRYAERYHELKLSRRVVVKNARLRGMRGRATYPGDRGPLRRAYIRTGREGRLVKLYLPPTPPADMEKFRRDFAWMVLHELGHNAGLSHLDMGVTSQLNKVWGSTEMPRGMEAFAAPAWEGAVPKTADEARAARAAGTAAAVEAREAKVTADIERWEAELARRESLVKRAKRKLSALRTRAAYYERRHQGVAERLTPRPANGTMVEIEPATLAAAKEPQC